MDKAALLKSELIGLNVKVLGLKIEGKIVDETKNMLIIEHNNKRKKTIKNSNVFEIKGINIDGKLLIGRSEERIKKNG